MFTVLLAMPMAVYAQEGEVEEVQEEVADEADLSEEEAAALAEGSEGERAAEEATEDHVEAVNKGDAEAAQVTMAEDATVTVPAATVTGEAAPPPAEGESDDGDDDAEAAVAADPAATQQYTGDQVEAWLEGQVAAGAQMNLENCTVAGETATCAARYTSNALAARGIDFLEGTLVTTVVEGQIQSYDFTPSADSVAKIQSAFAAPAPLPATGAPAALPATGGTTPDTNYLGLAAMGLLLLLAGAGTYAFQRRGA
jgi:hypothetical protein